MTTILRLGMWVFLLGLLALLALMVLGALPMSRHAADGHVDQYNAGNIIPLFQDGGCKPKSFYICAGEQVGFALCGIKPHQDIYGGIVIGWKTGTANVVTGYASRMDFWQKSVTRRDCIRVPYAVFGLALLVLPLMHKIRKAFSNK